MVSNQLLAIENSIQNLSLEEKLWLLDKILKQVRSISDLADNQPTQELTEIKYDNTVRPIWDIVVEIGEQIPNSEWEKIPSDLSKNFDFYQQAGEKG